MSLRRWITIAVMTIFLAAIISAGGKTETVNNLQSDRLIDFSVKMPNKESTYFFVGDTLIIKAEILVDKDFILDTKTLPDSVIKVNDFLELKSITAGFKPEAHGNRYYVECLYQIFFVPFKQSDKFIIPEYPLIFHSRTGRFTVFIPPYDLTISALTTDNERNRFEIVSDLEPIKPGAFNVKIISTILIILSAALLAWIFIIPWIMMLSQSRYSIFLAAIKEIGKSKTEKESFTIVYRAFEKYSGKAYFSHNLDQFFSEHCGFIEIKPEIQKFFARLNDLFFFEAKEKESLGEVLPELKKLLRMMNKLQTRERRRER